MKIKVLGFLIMLAGLSLIAYGISFLSVADTETSAAPETPSPSLKTGVYYLNANAERESITVYDDGTFELTGNPRQGYVFRQWSDIAVTDEVTGDIALVDLYFLGTNLNGAENYTEKIRYYPENDTLEYNGDYYFYTE